jgi:hypothetical protein
MNVIAATVRASAADEAGRPTRFDAEQAVRTLIRWAAEDPNALDCSRPPHVSHERSKNTSRDMPPILRSSFRRHSRRQMDMMK